MEFQLKKIEELKDFYLKILNNLDFGILIIDREGNIKFINTFLKDFFNLDKNSINKNLFIYFKGISHLEPFVKRIKECVSQNEANEITIKLIIQEQTKFLKIKVFNSLLENDVLIIITDVTELEELSRSLILSGKFSILGTIASGLAHEIKNPLTIINGHLYLLEDICSKYSDNDILHSLTVIEKQTSRIQDIVNLLLNFGKDNFSKKIKVNLSEIIKKSVSMCLPNAIKKKIKIINRVNKNIFISGVKIELEELLLNLLLNSIDAINHENGEILITYILPIEEKKKDIITIMISDNGEGIPDEVLDKVFDPFFTTKEKGSGLGLSICYKIMNNHNGNIKILSEQGKGTKVMLTFPLCNEGE